MFGDTFRITIKVEPAPFFFICENQCVMMEVNLIRKKGYVNGLKLDDDNPIFYKACQLVLDTDIPVIYLTGKAGTGKTTFLKYVTSQYEGNKVVLAPTARAAVNAGGQIIHSFFKYQNKIYDD